MDQRLTRASQATSRLEGGLNNVNKAASNTKQVASSVGQLASALSQGSISAAAFAGVNLAIDLSKMGEAFEVTTAAAKTTTIAIGETTIVIPKTTQAVTSLTSGVGFLSTGASRLWGILKANPLIAVVSALSAIGLAMSLFSSKTKEATDKFKEFLEETGKLRKREVTAANFPEQVQLQIARQKNTRLFDIATEIGTRDKPVTISELSNLTGYDSKELQAQFTNNQLSRYVRNTKEPVSPETARTYDTFPGLLGNNYLSPPGDYIVAPEDAVSALGSFYGTRDSQLEAREDALRKKPDDVKAATREAREAAKEANEAMDNVLDKAEQLGQTFGDAWYLFASGAQTGEQLVQSLVASYLRGISQDAGGTLFRSIQSAVSTAVSPTAPSKPTGPQPGFGSNGQGAGFGWGTR